MNTNTKAAQSQAAYNSANVNSWHTFSEPSTKTTQDRVSEWTQGSAVNPDLTAKWLEQETDPAKIAHLLGWKHYYHTPGWYVRTCDPITGKRDKSGQWKPDSPIIFPDSDKPAKYFSFPKGGDSDPLFSVMVLNDWVIISERTGVPIENDDIDESRDDLGFWKWVIKHPSIPIVITEGAKKAGCLLSHGYVAIALCGVWNGQKQKKLHPWLKHFIVPNRPVYLAFDADLVEKESVAAALKQFGRLCLNECRDGVSPSISIISWPLDLGKGVDDLIVNHGEAVFRMAMANSTDYSSFVKKLEKQFKNNNNDNSGAGNGKIPPADVIGGQLADEYSEHLKYCGELSSWLYFGLEDTGVWSLVSDDFVAHIVDNLLEARNIRGYGSNSYINSIIGKIKRQNYLKEWPESSLTEFYPLNNGVYEFATGMLHPHSPGFYLTWKLPRDFCPIATEWPNIDKWLTQATGGKQQDKDLLPFYVAPVNIKPNFGHSLTLLFTKLYREPPTGIGANRFFSHVGNKP